MNLTLGSVVPLAMFFAYLFGFLPLGRPAPAYCDTCSCWCGAQHMVLTHLSRLTLSNCNSWLRCTRHYYCEILSGLIAHIHISEALANDCVVMYKMSCSLRQNDQWYFFISLHWEKKDVGFGQKESTEEFPLSLCVVLVAPEDIPILVHFLHKVLQWEWLEVSSRCMLATKLVHKASAEREAVVQVGWEGFAPSRSTLVSNPGPAPPPCTLQPPPSFLLNNDAIAQNLTLHSSYPVWCSSKAEFLPAVIMTRFSPL